MKNKSKNKPDLFELKPSHLFRVKIPTIDSKYIMKTELPSFSTYLDNGKRTMTGYAIFMGMYNTHQNKLEEKLIKLNKRKLPFDIIIEQLSPKGYITNIWTLKNSHVDAINFGVLSYKNDGTTIANVKIRYDFASICYPDSKNCYEK